MKVKDTEKDKFDQFVKLNYYTSGLYDKDEDFQALNNKIDELMRNNSRNNDPSGNRIFYLALPPSVYSSVTKLLSLYCKAKK